MSLSDLSLQDLYILNQASSFRLYKRGYYTATVDQKFSLYRNGKAITEDVSEVTSNGQGDFVVGTKNRKYDLYHADKPVITGAHHIFRKGTSFVSTDFSGKKTLFANGKIVVSDVREIFEHPNNHFIVKRADGTYALYQEDKLLLENDDYMTIDGDRNYLVKTSKGLWDYYIDGALVISGSERVGLRHNGYIEVKHVDKTFSLYFGKKPVALNVQGIQIYSKCLDYAIQKEDKWTLYRDDKAFIENADEVTSFSNGDYAIKTRDDWALYRDGICLLKGMKSIREMTEPGYYFVDDYSGEGTSVYYGGVCVAENYDRITHLSKDTFIYGDSSGLEHLVYKGNTLVENAQRISAFGNVDAFLVYKDNHSFLYWEGKCIAKHDGQIFLHENGDWVVEKKNEEGNYKQSLYRAGKELIKDADQVFSFENGDYAGITGKNGMLFSGKDHHLIADGFDAIDSTGEGEYITSLFGVRASLIVNENVIVSNAQSIYSCGDFYIVKDASCQCSLYQGGKVLIDAVSQIMTASDRKNVIKVTKDKDTFLVDLKDLSNQRNNLMRFLYDVAEGHNDTSFTDKDKSYVDRYLSLLSSIKKEMDRQEVFTGPASPVNRAKALFYKHMQPEAGRL